MSTSFRDSLRPLHLLSKCTGFALFTFKPKTFQIFFSKFDAICVIFNIFVLFMLNLLYFTTYFSIRIHSSEIVKKYFPAISYVTCCMLTSTKIWHFCHRQNFAKFVELLSEIDGDLEVLGNHFNYKRHKDFTLAVMASTNIFYLLVSLSAYFSQEYHKMGIGWNVFMFVTWGFFVNLVLVTEFIVAVCAVKMRFEAVNKIIA